MKAMIYLLIAASMIALWIGIAARSNLPAAGDADTYSHALVVACSSGSGCGNVY